jgi:integrative and conjugative element protein (TIGR02256 family)
MLKFTHLDTDIILSDEVLDVLHAHKQLNVKDCEIGGQLFGYYNKNEIIIEKCSITHDTENSSRFAFAPSLKEEQKDIFKYYEQGLHYLGDWHTHPETDPNPSTTDNKTMMSRFKKSKHNLNFFILIVVGTNEFPYGLSVNIVDHKGVENICSYS